MGAICEFHLFRSSFCRFRGRFTQVLLNKKNNITQSEHTVTANTAHGLVVSFERLKQNKFLVTDPTRHNDNYSATAVINALPAESNGDAMFCLQSY